ncbi:MAG: PorT family protein [Prevotella sp.]|nr:PorT family protein [Prevotella sp.]
MKKIMMIAAMMVATLSANAQNEVGQFTLKPMVGLNLASMTKADNSKMRVGVAAGVEGEYGVAENFGITAGLLYSMQGVKESGSGTVNIPLIGNVAFTGDQTLKLDYLNIPILANYYIVKGLAVKAGIQPGFCVSKKVALKGTATNDGKTLNIDSDEKIEDGIKAFQFAIPVGLSYEYEGFVLDARYNIYATKAMKNTDSRHSLFTISLGYKFAL